MRSPSARRNLCSWSEAGLQARGAVVGTCESRDEPVTLIGALDVDDVPLCAAPLTVQTQRAATTANHRPWWCEGLVCATGSRSAGRRAKPADDFEAIAAQGPTDFRLRLSRHPVLWSRAIDRHSAAEVMGTLVQQDGAGLVVG